MFVLNWKKITKTFVLNWKTNKVKNKTSSEEEERRKK